MPKVSSIKHSPIAKYLVENKAHAYKKNGYVEFRDAENKLIGKLKNGEAPCGQYRYINIDLYKHDSNQPFIKKRVEIYRCVRYFLKEHRFMPVSISIKNTIFDFEHNSMSQDTLTRGLSSDRYIDTLKDSKELKAERKKLGMRDNFPMYEINKPFKYEFKSHLYSPALPINSSKPIIKE